MLLLAKNFTPNFVHVLKVSIFIRPGPVLLAETTARPGTIISIFKNRRIQSAIVVLEKNFKQ